MFRTSQLFILTHFSQYTHEARLIHKVHRDICCDTQRQRSSRD
eukprot:IDg7873t1